MKKKNKTQPFTDLTDEASVSISGGHFFDIFHQWNSIEPHAFDGLQPHFRSYHHHYHYEGKGSGIVIDQYSSFNIVIH